MNRKNVYILIGTAALVLSIGITAYLLGRAFHQRSITEEPSPDSTDDTWSVVYTADGTDSGDAGWNTEDEESFIKEQEYSELKNVTVRIQAGESMASGFVLDVKEDAVIICTAKHLVLESYESTVTFADGGIGRAKSVFYSNQHDLAFLRMDAEDNPNFSDFTAYDSVSLLSTEEMEKLSKGKELVVVASLSGPGEDVVKGNISNPDFFARDFNDWMILVDCVIEHGYSGGGVFTKDGKLLGMVVGSDGTYGVCIPQTVIIDEYRNRMEE